jgi:polyisoprenoid-binding protein YceI
MKKFAQALAAVGIFLLSFTPANEVLWKLDVNHSGLGFSIVHLGMADLKGSIKINKASITSQGEGFDNASVMLEADMTSIDTDNEKRDAHLQTADFFDAVKYPVMTFQSTTFTKKSEGVYNLMGNLTLHGVTKPVTLSLVMKAGTNPTNNKPMAACKVTGSIKRTDFGISAATPSAIISDDVAIEANLEFSKE